MCDLTLALMAAGTAISAMGSIQQGKAAAGAAQYNAKVAEIQAKDAEARGAVEEQNHRLKVGQMIGAQRSLLAGQGSTLDDGSPVDILADTAMLGELDAQNIRAETAREAWGYRSQAALYRSEGKNARMAGYLSAGSSLLSGAASVAGKWQNRYGSKPAVR